MINQDIEVGLTVDEEHEAWKRYEMSGNMAKVARDMMLPYHKVRSALNRDQIRMHEVQKVRAEEHACVWEAREQRAASMSAEIMDVLDGILRHIRECIKNGAEFTDLKDMLGKPYTPTQAYQWVLGTKQLDLLTKVAATAAKISAGLRQYAAPLPMGNSANVGSLTNQDLARMVSDFQLAGQTIPPALQEWVRVNQQQQSLPALVHSA